MAGINGLILWIVFLVGVLCGMLVLALGIAKMLGKVKR